MNKKFCIKIAILLILQSSFLCILLKIFNSVLYSSSVLFPYAIHPFDIANLYPTTWKKIKYLFLLSCSISFFLIVNQTINFISTNYKGIPKLKKLKKFSQKEKKCDLSILIGLDNNIPCFLPEFGLYQNILITGTIGTGKTSSAMYPFTKQLIHYMSNNPAEKLAMLVLDVKGNYFKEVINFANQSNRLNDIITIDLSGRFKYNPLDKPELKPIVLANRLKTILTLFSPNNQESFWLDKSEQILSECIKFCRLYNDGYVTFSELHKLILYTDYYQEKLSILKEMFRNNKFSEAEIYDLLYCIDFFEKEFFSLDARTLSILRSEISRITNIFVSDYSVLNSFCPSKKNINFYGFKDVLNSGKIVVLNMNISEYKNLSKIIAAYLKLDFQSEVMSRLGKNEFIRKSVFISDEFHEYVTTTDADFFAQSREAKCINIVATQSYSSIRNALKDDNSTKVIIQNMINKLWYRTDDLYTIEEAQKQIGKEDKIKISRTISENAKETKLNFITNNLISSNSSISESYNKSTNKEFIYDTNYFTQKLKTFKSLVFLSDGSKILPIKELDMLPFYKD